ncbi:hypothetical protein NFI96_006448 [Prochilodus magdalenae]|nr:hypothetical protein NFI96_006448 [Prochilodus magdalenae]
MHSSNHIIKFADDMTVVGLISKNDESAYREEVQRLTDWCRTNNLSLNVDKTKEMVVDFRRTRHDHSPLHIDGSTVEIVKSTKFLGVHLAEDLTWSLNKKKMRRMKSNNTKKQSFDLMSFVHTLAAIHTIETINDSGFLPGIKLGYLMCDPCAYATKALHCVEQTLAVNGSFPVLSDYSNFTSTVKAFLGERYSELSIPVAKLLSLYMIPQISSTSSSPALSDKSRYASFFRVIPSDVHQTKALAKLMKYFNWTWVGVVTLDDDYGKPALENFLTNSGKEGICVEFPDVLPNYLGSVNIEQRIKEVADRIRNATAQVVLLILRPEHVEMLFKEMIKTNTTRIWIASDAWCTARFLMTMKDINKVGEIFGFTFLTGKIPGFEDYLKNLVIRPGVRNDFIREYKQLRFNCTQQSPHTSTSACSVTGPQKENDDYLLRSVDLSEAYNQRVAVYAIAHAIRRLLQCTDTACSGDTNLLPWQLVSILREISFTLDNQTYSFDEYGDFENAYELISWKKNGDERLLEVVGKYLIKNEEIEVYDNKIPWTNKTVPLSRCSEPCRPGTEKSISNISCCYNCTNCTQGYYSNETVEETPSQSQSLTLNRLCTQGSTYYGFGAMHVYIALLAVLCFLLAFKVRDSETEPIVFSMLIHLFAWFCFIPVFITQNELRPIVQISAIMVSNYGVIFCHFAPKWFKIFSEKTETKTALKTPVDPLTDDHDSGMGCTVRSNKAVSMRSVSQNRFSFAESEASNWDIHSLQLSEVSFGSIRRRRSRRQRPRSL